MRYCQRCGVPRILTSEHSWDSSGMLFLTRDPTHRMVILDNEALNHILDSIADRIGIPVEQIIVEAKRKSGKHFMNAVLSGIKGTFARNLASAKVYQQLAHQTAMLGLGTAQVVAYKRHSFLEGMITDAYNPAAIAGDICGAFESVEHRFGEVSYQTEGNSLRLSITASGSDAEEYLDRFSYEPPPVIDGRNIFELCPLCRGPKDLGRSYDFDIEAGLIHEKKTGHRTVLVGVMTLKSLFGELESELGEEIPRLIMGIEKERVRGVIAAKGRDLDSSEEGYLRFLKTTRLKGMGNGVSVGLTDGTVKARVDNPYFEPLIAGMLGGFFEAATGGDAEVEWTDGSTGFTEVTLRPA